MKLAISPKAPVSKASLSFTKLAEQLTVGMVVSSLGMGWTVEDVDIAGTEVTLLLTEVFPTKRQEIVTLNRWDLVFVK